MAIRKSNSQGIFYTLFCLIWGVCFSTPTLAQDNEFSQCLTKLGALAQEQGVSQSTQALVADLKYQAKVIELDRNQPEFMQTFPAYFGKRVNDWRINKGRQMYAKHKDFLAELNAKYGIPRTLSYGVLGLRNQFWWV